MAAVVSNGVTAAAGVISCLLEALRIIYSSYTLSDLNKQPVKQVNLSRFWFRYAVPLTDQGRFSCRATRGISMRYSELCLVSV